jgi:hypothetical protein
MLLMMDSLALQTVQTIEQAEQALAGELPDIFLIFPRGLEIPAICELCGRFLPEQGEQVVFLVEPFLDPSERESFCGWQAYEVTTSDRLKNFILEKAAHPLANAHKGADC